VAIDRSVDNRTELRLLIGDSSRNRLVALQERLGLERFDSVFRRSLKVLDWLTRVTAWESGTILIIARKDGTEIYRADIADLIK